MKDERRERLRSNKVYQAMEGLTRYMDRYYLDALIVLLAWLLFTFGSYLLSLVS